MPTISVIIPVYNGEKTIKQTVESVLNQTFRDFELLIINDGSQDATLEIIQAINDERIQVFSYQNSGVSASRNRALTKAKGEFISFIDADDLWTPNKLELQLKLCKITLKPQLLIVGVIGLMNQGNFCALEVILPLMARLTRSCY
jgi:glycosyltransferase involved in cell wall biosynthesis